MAYKCLDCGHIFKDGEERVEREYHDEIPGGFYEEITSCPVCGGEYEKTMRCEECGGEFLADELYWGRCEECLKDALTAESFLDFSESDLLAKDESSVHIVEDFMLTTVYGLESKDLICSSKEFRKLLITEYKKFAESNNKITDKIWTYLKERWMIQDFSEYLDWKEAKK